MKKEFDVTFAGVYSLVEGEIRAGHSFVFTPNGVSMLPTIVGGKDVATLSPLSGDPKKNDIVFYRRDNGGFVLHRVVRRPKNGVFTLCGDNQSFLEKGVRRDQLLARLTSLSRDGKKIPLRSLRARLFAFFLPVRRFYLRSRSFLRSRFR